MNELMITQYQHVNDTIKDIRINYDVLGVINLLEYDTRWVELYLALKKLHQTKYQNNQRIIITLQQDYYDNNETHGIILQSLQTILNDLDISNFFICLVTTNHNVENEYKYVLNTFSIDPVPFNVYLCNNKPYNKITETKIPPYRKVESISRHIDDISNLSKDQIDLLFNSDVFCMAPWTSAMVYMYNEVKPCCTFTGSVGDSSKQSLKEIWNSPEFKEIRRKMLNGEPVAGCTKCYVREDYKRDTLRKSFNRRFSKHIKKVDDTNADGSLETFELNYIDTRFNNLCNLSCRSCNHKQSSSWHKPATELGLIAKDTPMFLKAGRSENDLLEQTLDQIDNVESIYFAGGEPLIIEEFYQIVDALDAKNKHQVELIYNTNMTKYKLKERDIFDLWKNFTNISIGASLDAEGERGEYLRSGCKWNDIVDFRLQLMKKRPDIDFSVSATLGIINALHVPDFHRSWVEKGLIKPEEFHIGILFGPDYLRVETAPHALKEKIKEKYNKHLEWLRPLDKQGKAIYSFESILEQIKKDVPFDRKLFWNNVNSLDGYYKTDLLNVFPELEDLK